MRPNRARLIHPSPILIVGLAFYGCLSDAPGPGVFRLTKVAGHSVPDAVAFASPAKTILVDSGFIELFPANGFRTVMFQRESTLIVTARVDSSRGTYTVDGARLHFSYGNNEFWATFEGAHIRLLSSVERLYEYERACVSSEPASHCRLGRR